MLLMDLILLMKHLEHCVGIKSSVLSSFYNLRYFLAAELTTFLYSLLSLPSWDPYHFLQTAISLSVVKNWTAKKHFTSTE